MKHLGTQKLETERLTLRRFIVGDDQAMFDNWASDSEVTKFLMWPTHENVETSEKVLADWIGHYGEGDFYQWAITFRGKEENPIGSISVVAKNDKIEMVHIGYCIGRKWWNQGITSEALGALIEFFINTVGINRIESRHDPNNPNSGKVMLKCGMKLEGMMKEADWNNQGICDIAVYAILAKNYGKGN